MGIADDVLKEGLARFKGVKRRFTKVGEAGGITVIDDYGHHPVEIAAVLKAARTAASGRVIAVVQPHRYTRLQSLFAEFCQCFNDADHVVVADVYPAGEAPISGVDRDALINGLHAHGHPAVTALISPKHLAAVIDDIARPGDVVVCLGAGNITAWAHALPGDLAAIHKDQPQRGGARHDGSAPSIRRLVERLPRVRGRYEPMADLGKLTWFRVGGPAEALFTPADVEDLSAFLKACPRDVALTVIGLGANMLVRDGGVPGVVIRLAKAFAMIEADGLSLRCGAGAINAAVATAARDAGIAGFEFLTGIPGTIGGGLRMNAGAYGREFKDIFASATALDRSGTIHKLDCAAMGFHYRHIDAAADLIFIGAEIAGVAGDADAITARMREIRTEREQSQPTQARTGGSTFANPPGNKAWALIDAAGCRGLTRGGAQVSPKHTNFLINTGAATAADLEGLGEDVRARVLAKSGVELRWEIRRIGVAAGDPSALTGPA